MVVIVLPLADADDPQDDEPRAQQADPPEPFPKEKDPPQHACDGAYLAAYDTFAI
jgi:hypothetical protein